MDENNKNDQMPQEAQVTEQTATTQEEQPVTLESLMTELSKVRAESAKNKAALDKALHNNGELTKQLREKMSASEKEAEAKREAEEQQANRIKELEDYKRRSEARERYLAMGMAPDLAKDAAEAEVAGDMEGLTSVYKKNTDFMLKAKEAEWLKSQPKVNAGHGEGADAEDPFLKGWNAGTI